MSDLASRNDAVQQSGQNSQQYRKQHPLLSLLHQVVVSDGRSSDTAFQVIIIVKMNLAEDYPAARAFFSMRLGVAALGADHTGLLGGNGVVATSVLHWCRSWVIPRERSNRNVAWSPTPSLTRFSIQVSSISAPGDNSLHLNSLVLTIKVTEANGSPFIGESHPGWRNTPITATEPLATARDSIELPLQRDRQPLAWKLLNLMRITGSGSSRPWFRIGNAQCRRRAGFYCQTMIAAERMPVAAGSLAIDQTCSGWKHGARVDNDGNRARTCVARFRPDHRPNQWPAVAQHLLEIACLVNSCPDVLVAFQASSIAAG